MVYVFVVVVDAAMLAPAVVAAAGDLAVLGDFAALGDLLAVAGVLPAVLAEWALALTACEQENPVRPSVRRTAMIPAIFRMTR
jgi:hypothetical protein